MPSVMEIDGVRCVEANPVMYHGDDTQICEQCVFFAWRSGCRRALEGAAQAAFGRNCASGDVIYVRQEQR